MDPALVQFYDTLKAAALALPEAWEDHPWGESVIKVGKKVFIFMGHSQDTSAVSFSVKLPHSMLQALETPGASPTGYGLARGGWVTLRVEHPPESLDQVMAWLRESYRAVAPKKLSKQVMGS